MRSTLGIAALTLALTIAAPVFAAGPNGGRTTVVEGHPVEFVPSATAATFFLNDHDGAPLETTDLSAKAFVQAGGRTETLTLKPAAPNKFVAALKAPLPAGTKVVLVVKVPGHTIQARFEM